MEDAGETEREWTEDAGEIDRECVDDDRECVDDDRECECAGDIDRCEYAAEWEMLRECAGDTDRDDVRGCSDADDDGGDRDRDVRDDDTV